ncbi:hypothetical protein TNCT_76021 [Trichonephila clavata]|uniref:Uncharacterized protein n=1 Tax=Trichonephila clavata TaxID=2740835 RepID=A0A8X6HQL8_TRICU|nr:hypothetical protein TNCT_76021 [Trichonephila clavata]
MGRPTKRPPLPSLDPSTPKRGEKREKSFPCFAVRIRFWSHASKLYVTRRHIAVDQCEPRFPGVDIVPPPRVDVNQYTRKATSVSCSQ